MSLIPSGDRRQALIDLAVNSVDSEHSKRAYQTALSEFFHWLDTQDQRGLSKDLLNRYRGHLLDRGLSASSVNVKLSACRNLVRALADNTDVITPVEAEVIAGVENAQNKGTKTGVWLTEKQTEALINAPDPTTLKGKRDRALLGVLVLSGLRRDEVTRLTAEHIVMLENRWVILDITGKHGKTRTVPINSVLKSLLDSWTQAADIKTGVLWRGFTRGDSMTDEPISTQAIWNITKLYCRQIGIERIAPHDLRRTYAKLAFKSGCPIEQISLSLGHSSIKTTEIYLGIEQDLQNAPSDYIRLNISGEE